MSEFSNQKFSRHKSIGTNTNSVFCSLCGTNDYIAFSNGDKELVRPNFFPAMGLFSSVGENIDVTGGKEMIKMKEVELNFKPNFQAPVPYGFYFPMLPLAYSPFGFSNSFCVPVPRRMSQEERDELGKDNKILGDLKNCEVHAQECCMRSVSEESKMCDEESAKCEIEREISESQSEKVIDTNIDWDNKEEAIGCLKPPSMSCVDLLKEKSENEFVGKNIEKRMDAPDSHKMEVILEGDEDFINKPKDEVKLRKSRFQTFTTTNKPIPNEEEQKKAQIFIRDIIEQMKDKPEPQKVCHTILKNYQEKTKDFLNSKTKNSEDKKFKSTIKDPLEKNIPNKDVNVAKSKIKLLPQKDVKPIVTTRKVKKISEDAKKIWAI